RGYFNSRSISFHHYDAAFRHVIEAPVVLEIVANGSIFRNTDVLIQNCPANFGAPADVAVVQNDGVFHQNSGVHAHVPPDDRIAHHATGKDGTAGDDRVDGLAAPVLVVEGELGGRIRESGGPEGPFAIVEVERGGNR